MNPLLNKETRLHRSVSAKVNSEEEKHRIFKPSQQSLDFQRQFNLRAKGIDVPSAQHMINAKINQNQQPFIKNTLLESYAKHGTLSARQQLKSKLNPCNPFESLTESSIRRNPENQKAMELILAHKKIKEMESSFQSINKDLLIVKQQKFQLQTQYSNQLSTLKAQLNEITNQNSVLQNKNNGLSMNLEVLMLENKNLKLQVSSLKLVKDNLSEKQQENSIINPEKQAEKFKELGQDFQRKINDLYDQNYKLKNKVSWFEGKLQESETLVSSLKSLNELLEKRFSQEEEEGETLKEKLLKENDRLREENLGLKEDRQRLKSDHEMQILKLQNEVEDLKTQVKQKVLSEKQSYKQHHESLRMETEKLNGGSSYKKILKLEDTIISLKQAVKQQVDQIQRLKEKNKRFAKMIK